MVAVLAAALTFVIVFWTVVELGLPWIRFGGLAYAGEVKGPAAPDGGRGSWSVVPPSTTGAGQYVVGADGRLRFYAD
jgi:hypothetical protein